MVELNHVYSGYLFTPGHFKLAGHSNWPGIIRLESEESEKIVDHLVEMAGEFMPGRGNTTD